MYMKEGEAVVTVKVSIAKAEVTFTPPMANTGEAGETGQPGEASEVIAMSDLSVPGGTSEPEEVTAVFEAEE